MEPIARPEKLGLKPEMAGLPAKKTEALTRQVGAPVTVGRVTHRARDALPLRAVMEPFMTGRAEPDPRASEAEKAATLKIIAIIAAASEPELALRPVATGVATAVTPPLTPKVEGEGGATLPQPGRAPAGPAPLLGRVRHTPVAVGRRPSPPRLLMAARPTLAKEAVMVVVAAMAAADIMKAAARGQLATSE